MSKHYARCNFVFGFYPSYEFKSMLEQTKWDAHYGKVWGVNRQCQSLLVKVETRGTENRDIHWRKKISSNLIGVSGIA